MEQNIGNSSTTVQVVDVEREESLSSGDTSGRHSNHLNRKENNTSYSNNNFNNHWNNIVLDDLCLFEDDDEEYEFEEDSNIIITTLTNAFKRVGDLFK